MPPSAAELFMLGPAASVVRVNASVLLPVNSLEAPALLAGRCRWLQIGPVTCLQTGQRLLIPGWRRLPIFDSSSTVARSSVAPDSVLGELASIRMFNPLTDRMGIRGEVAGRRVHPEGASTDGSGLAIQERRPVDTGKDLRAVPEKTAGISLVDLNSRILPRTEGDDLTK